MTDPITKNSLQAMPSGELARYLKEKVWDDLASGSVESDVVEAAFKRLENKAACLCDDKYLENLEWANKSYHAAYQGRPVPCRGCEKTFQLYKLFRCYHCGSYFCTGCAPKHFGKRDSRILHVVERINKNMESS